jgi:hypothetical protein
MKLPPNMPDDTPEEVDEAANYVLRFFDDNYQCDGDDFLTERYTWVLVRQYLRERAAKIERGKCKKGKKAMSKRIEITWQADDCYVSGKRPHHTMIHESDLADCETETEVLSLLEQSVKDDFEQKVSPSWDREQEAKLLARWREMKEEPSNDAD